MAKPQSTCIQIKERAERRAGKLLPFGRSLLIGLGLLLGVSLFSGCAALAPFSSVISGPLSGSPTPQVYEQTRVDLNQANFELVKTNVWGQSRGFSLFGIITIVPPTLSKATARMYAAAQMTPGRPQSISHLIVEQSSSFYILFGIPKVRTRADIIEFSTPKPAEPPKEPPAPDRTAF